MYLVCWSHPNLVKEYLKEGADVDAMDKSGGTVTALMYAASRGYADVVRVLLDAGANVNLKSNSGNTALIYAALWGHADVVKILLDSSWLDNEDDLDFELLDAMDNIGGTALIYAAGWGHADVVNILLKNKANVNLIARWAKVF